ncbi:adenosine deaminase family protein [Aerosakkonema funiforme]|uniref:Adenosine deaminase family protein n=1 Tax=Aerosakkonema funiforme FACHB-1375 TaxID=2949571 RepID=A0A926VKY9_9CYAN|nr:adenosine deaminase family protein [Aerosakkonema funiforme]MBD2185731.1 adenosine deaminase family protein [Aerosakkonema funiforme FACHB-1375]
MLEVTKPEEITNIADISSMPKAELHIHLEGAPRWQKVREVWHRHKGIVLPESPFWYEQSFRFANFEEFRLLFRDYIHPWLQTPSGYNELIRDVFDAFIEQNIRYVELDFYVPLVERVGASLDRVLALLEEEVERARSHGTIIRMFAGLNRNEGAESASYWVQKVISEKIISGFDLHGSEFGWPADIFKEAFAPVFATGKKVKVHAGEMTGPETIRAAVEGLGVKQIGHGTSAIQDPDVVELLRDRQILVEMCPTSNERLANVSSYQDHPILALDAAGVAVTVNSDDPTWFGLNLTEEMVRLMCERGVTVADLGRWTRNAFEGAIVEEETRSAFLTELDEWLVNLATK